LFGLVGKQNAPINVRLLLVVDQKKKAFALQINTTTI
jgi:hypothetical protein